MIYTLLLVSYQHGAKQKKEDIIMVNTNDEEIFKYFCEEISSHLPFCVSNEGELDIQMQALAGHVRNILLENPGLCEYINTHHIINSTELHTLTFSINPVEYMDPIKVCVKDPYYEGSIYYNE